MASGDSRGCDYHSGSELCAQLAYNPQGAQAAARRCRNRIGCRWQRLGVRGKRTRKGPLHAVGTGVREDKLHRTLTEARGVLYSAQLDFGRALARVRITCPQKIVDAAENYGDAVMEFEQMSRASGSVALDMRQVGMAASPVEGTVRPLARLVEATIRAT